MPKNLVEKIAEACKGINGVLRKGDNGEYAYLRILDISNALREKLFEAGIVIVPDDLECYVERRAVPDMPGRVWTEAQVKTQFTVSDGIDKFTLNAWGFARDMDAKCVAIAQTAALKSFLKRLALIFGDYDDPEVRDETIADLRPDLQRKIDEQTCISRTEVRALYSAIKKSGRSLEEYKEFLNADLGVSDPSQIVKQDLARAMAWALGAQPNEPS